MEFQLSNFLRAAGSLETLEQVSLKELLKLAGATGFQPSESPRYGSRLILMKGNERAQVNGQDVQGIRLGKSVKLANDFTSLEGVKELISNHVIYHGKGENGYWMAFGTKGDFKPGAVYSLDQMKEVVGVL